MKYIIKNCDIGFENIENNFVCPYKSRKEGLTVYCKDITDCLLKQIVEKCKYFKNKIMQDITYKKGADMVANEILNILEIEAVDE